MACYGLSYRPVYQALGEKGSQPTYYIEMPNPEEDVPAYTLMAPELLGLQTHTTQSNTPISHTPLTHAPHPKQHTLADEVTSRLAAIRYVCE